MSNARSLNKVILVGRVGKEPEIKKTKNDSLVATFSIATVNGYMDKDNVWQESTEWHNVTAWGNTANIVDTLVGKGNLVLAEGMLKYSEWEDKDEKKHKSTNIIINSIILLDKSKKNKQQNQQ